MTQEYAYVEDPGPGRGRLRPRAWFGSSLPFIDLNGRWRFRLAAGLPDLSPGFERPEFDDSWWAELAVPSFTNRTRPRSGQREPRPAM